MMEKQGHNTPHLSWQILKRSSKPHALITIPKIDRFTDTDFRSALWFFNRREFHINSMMGRNVLCCTVVFNPPEKSILEKVTETVKHFYKLQNKKRKLASKVKDANNQFQELKEYYRTCLKFYNSNDPSDIIVRSRIKKFLAPFYISKNELKANKLNTQFFESEEKTKLSQFEEEGCLECDLSQYRVYHDCIVALLNTLYFQPEHFKKYYFKHVQGHLYLFFAFSEGATFNNCKNKCPEEKEEHQVVIKKESLELGFLLVDHDTFVSWVLALDAKTLSETLLPAKVRDALGKTLPLLQTALTPVCAKQRVLTPLESFFFSSPQERLTTIKEYFKTELTRFNQAAASPVEAADMPSLIQPCHNFCERLELDSISDVLGALGIFRITTLSTPQHSSAVAQSQGPAPYKGSSPAD